MPYHLSDDAAAEGVPIITAVFGTIVAVIVRTFFEDVPKADLVVTRLHWEQHH